MCHATRWPELLVGVDWIEILHVSRDADCVAVTIETTTTVAFGTPTRLVWRKRRWVCPHDGCGALSRMDHDPISHPLVACW